MHFSGFFVVFEGNGSPIGWISGGRLEGIGWTMAGRRVNEPKTKDERRNTRVWTIVGRRLVTSKEGNRQ